MLQERKNFILSLPLSDSFLSLRDICEVKGSRNFPPSSLPLFPPGRSVYVDQVFPVTGGSRETIVPELRTLHHIKRTQSSSDGCEEWSRAQVTIFFRRRPSFITEGRECNGGERGARLRLQTASVGVFVTTSLRARGMSQRQRRHHISHVSTRLPFFRGPLSLAHSRFSSKPNTTNLVSLRSFLCLHFSPARPFASRRQRQRQRQREPGIVEGKLETSTWREIA